MKDRIAIISDFDGTIAERDIGHHFLGGYISDSAGREKLLESWKLGLISSRECLEQEIRMLDAGKAELDRFIEGEKLDPFIKDFVDFCNRRKFEFLIVSDGLDYYIDRMLMKHGLGYLEFRANQLLFDGDRITAVEFPWYDLRSCEMCGNCKRAHVEELAGKGFQTVYIGNGYSDRCPIEYADIVFAKGELLDHCRRINVDCIGFDNFRDVERELTSRLFMT